ncbi:C2 domain-containing protein 5-like, partial [Dendropsophus ebraccatus]|uniref:C2 domain-containing protein 5-like n=1 Tax=Dendropsophus ebraccatus TaxID=150705 RepID=UPI003832183E
IRGEINVVVKVDLFNDLNRFPPVVVRSEVLLHHGPSQVVPGGGPSTAFVEELVVNEDPEYQWIDRIRTPRASNEARQRLISLMSEKIGLKVLEMRGNAVVGYLQCFDLEGESGLVVRAIGTACTLDKLTNPAPFPPACHSPCKELKETPFNEELIPNTHSSGPSTPLKNQTYSFSPSKSYSRQSSSSDTDLSLTPKTALIPKAPRYSVSPSSPGLTQSYSLLLASSVSPPHTSGSRPRLRKSISLSDELMLSAGRMAAARHHVCDLTNN